jgi:hemoglobin
VTDDHANPDHGRDDRAAGPASPDPVDPSAGVPVETRPEEVFDRVGGIDAFEALVEAFYAKVASDDLLRPMYPEDLEPGKRHLTLFFAQYWGGGDLYGRERGHPRLRMRHAPFPITPEAALRWAELMAESIRELRFASDVEALLLAYVARATPTLINQLPAEVTRLPGDPGSAPGRA